MSGQKFSFIIFLFLFSFLTIKAQVQYEISKDPKHPEVKVLKGIINKSLIENDTSFNWYNSSKTIYYPDSSIVNSFKKVKDSFEFVLFGGTWCDDTQFILPKFFRLQELAGIDDSLITFFGVDRDKKTLGHIAEAFGITNVPTIIIMKNGKELGRVVEYGKTGKWDKELADIINAN
ncbi:MAG TPA: thioredoxin family protein [Chitinophagaceae bacterium]|nr:thioredoxin family protein [Chitinophagaceae bacterium]